MIREKRASCADKRPREQQILRVPGYRLRAWARFLFSPKTFVRVFEPILNDLVSEYQESLAAGDSALARWVLVRGYLAFWLAVGLLISVTVGKPLTKVWRLIR